MQAASLLSPAWAGKFFTASATWEAPNLGLGEPAHVCLKLGISAGSSEGDSTLSGPSSEMGIFANTLKVQSGTAQSSQAPAWPSLCLALPLRQGC